MCETDYLLITNILGILSNRLGVYIKYTTKSWARPLVVATEVLLPLARCQRCFTQSDRSLLFKWYNQQLKGRGWSKWQRFNNAKPRTPGRTCPTSHVRHIEYIRFMWPAAAVGSHSASTPSLLWYKFRHSGHFVMHGPVYYLKGTQIVNKYLNIIITISWQKKILLVLYLL